MLGQSALQRFSESIARERLDDVVRRTRAQTGDSGIESVETGGYDNRGFRMKAMELLDEPEAALAARQVDVAEGYGRELLWGEQ